MHLIAATAEIGFDPFQPGGPRARATQSFRLSLPSMHSPPPSPGRQQAGSGFMVASPRTLPFRKPPQARARAWRHRGFPLVFPAMPRAAIRFRRSESQSEVSLPRLAFN